MKPLPAMLLIALAVAASAPAPADDPGGNPTVRLIEFETSVTPFTALRIVRGIDEAEQAGDELVLIRLDTPGGLVSSTEKIVKRMLSAEVPVVVWVGPAGSHAASAGFFILLAADVAAMAPGTRTGAASTVLMGQESKDDNVLLRKANEDAAALLRSIADRRGRDVEAAEQAVFAAKAYEERVALEKGLVDLVSPGIEELLEALDGREVTLFDGTTVTLQTSGARFQITEFGFRHTVMELIANPTFAYLLFMVGLLGLYIEFSHPGLIFPGVVGGLCLLLFALAAQALPVSAVGVLLILLGIIMFILEIKVTSFGMLTVGGIVSLVLGSLMLIDGPIPALRVPTGVVVPASLVIAAFCVVAVRLAVRAQRDRVQTGVEGLTDEIGTVTHTLGPEGKVFVHGELWNAASAVGTIAEGTRVRVVRVDNMCLTVEPADDESQGRG